MNQIEKTAFLAKDDAIEFITELAKIIEEMQAKGLTVEIQYQSNNNYLTSALVLGRRELELANGGR